jgi:hypothetical protein
MKYYFMKSIKLFFAVLFFVQVAFAQNSLVNDGTVTTQSPSFFLDYLRDEKSADLFRPDVYAGVEGTPFLSESWAYARIMLADGRKFDSVLLKLNLYENKIHFKDQNGRERMVATQVREIEIRDASSKWNNAVFVSGYGEDKNMFFQALADGNKAELLKKMNVIIKELKVFNAPNQRSFELQERLYIYSSGTGTLYQESKNCSSLLSAFGNDSKVNSFISSNDIKCNKEKDLKKLVDYYNSY